MVFGFGFAVCCGLKKLRMCHVHDICALRSVNLFAVGGVVVVVVVVVVVGVLLRFALRHDSYDWVG